MTVAVDASHCGQWKYMCTVSIAIFKRSVSSDHLSAGCVLLLCICFTVEVSVYCSTV